MHIPQKHSLSYAPSQAVVRKFKTPASLAEVSVTNLIPIDQFFSQSHNLKYGFVDTSPLMFDDPQAAAHMSPVEPEHSWPVGTTDEEIYNSIIPKSFQTPSELSRLSRLKPNEASFIEDETVSSPEEVSSIATVES